MAISQKLGIDRIPGRFVISESAGPKSMRPKLGVLSYVEGSRLCESKAKYQSISK